MSNSLTTSLTTISLEPATLLFTYSSSSVDDSTGRSGISANPSSNLSQIMPPVIEVTEPATLVPMLAISKGVAAPAVKRVAMPEPMVKTPPRIDTEFPAMVVPFLVV